MRFIGKVVDGRIVPLGRKCVINDCGKTAAGLFSWPDEDTRVWLCERHARILMLRADFLDRIETDG